MGNSCEIDVTVLYKCSSYTGLFTVLFEDCSPLRSGNKSFNHTYIIYIHVKFFIIDTLTMWFLSVKANTKPCEDDTERQ